MKYVVRLLIPIILIPFFATQATGQPNYIFHHLTSEDGLSNSSVRTILKDINGFLWIGTESGLNRYDGYNFKVYMHKSEETNSLLSNDILGLNQDGSGHIWINMGFSYMVYNRNKDNFISDIPKLLSKYGIDVDRNFKIYIDTDRNLWVLTEQKAYYYDFQTNKLSTFGFIFYMDEVLSIELSDNGYNLYGIVMPGVLWQLNKKTGNQTLSKIPFLKEKNSNDIHFKMYADSQNGLWIYPSKTDSIHYQKNSVSEWETIVLNSVVKSQSNIVLNIMDDYNGNIWIGTDHEGVFVYNRKNNSITNILSNRQDKTSIASNNIGCIYKDDKGVIWLGHGKKGISYYHDSFLNIKNVKHPECRDISIIYEDVKGDVWFGTDGNGLFYRDAKDKSNIRKLPFPNSAIVSLLKDRKGRIWIGTYLNGLYCYENGAYKHFSKENSRVAGNNIWDLVEDRYGNIWICMLGGGVQYFRPESENLDTLTTACEGITYPMDMYYDGGDTLYISTVYGLCMIDISRGTESVLTGNNQGTQNFKQMSISNVFRDKNNNLWLGHSQGLTLWDTRNDSLYYFDKENGLSDNIIRGITEDKFGYIWISTTNGLSILSAKRDSQGIIKVTTRKLTTKDGLMDNYFNNHAICKLNNGNILVGGPEGYSIINPNKMAEINQPLAKVLFTRLSIGNTEIQVDSIYNGRKLLNCPIEQTSSLKLRHKDKLIGLNFTTGDLLNSDKVKYAYKLKGFNDQWLTIQENKIEFSSLPPGSYKLYIKASNSDGIWNTVPTTLDILVAPPFYLSIWAIIIYILSGIGLTILIIYRTRRRHLNKLENQRQQMERLQEANINEMKLRFFTNISHDLRTPLTLIITPLQNILEGSLEEGIHKKLTTIYRNAEHLLKLINSLLDFRKLDVGAEAIHLKQGDFVNFVRNTLSPFQAYASDKQISFSFLNEIESLPMLFDPEKVQKILLNLISNAFKYTPGGGIITVYICREKDYVCVSVSDTGKGIAEPDKMHIFERFYQVSEKHENTGSGIGLHIVSEYVHLHEGTISVEDNIPHGCIFTFKLPIKTSDIPEGAETEETGAEEEVLEQPEIPESETNPVLLFVDDNLDFCEFMADSLSDDYNVLVAYNGKEALELLDKNDVNIVVSDVMMPVMSGIELCKQIKENIHWSHIPVILLTARTSEEYKIESLELGADDYLTKPFNFNLLKLRIQKFLEWRNKCHVSFREKMDISPSEITITSLDEQLIEKAIKVVEENLTNTEFSVEELSASVGLSRSHLYKKLMSITGRGPAEFIRTIRLKRGRQLLEKSQMQIAEIAYTVGFNSPKRFTINFKNEFGMLPSDFQRNSKDTPDGP